MKNLARYIPACGLIVWMMMIILSFWLLSDWDEYISEAENRETLLFQAIGVFSFLAAQATTPSRLFTALQPSRDDWAKVLSIHVFFAVIAVFSYFSLVPFKSIVYVLLTWGVFIGARVVWMSEVAILRRAFQFVCCGYFASLLLLLAYRGLDGRWVGGVQPNQFGEAAMIAVVCASFAGGYLRIAATGLAYGLALLVSSRSSLVALTLFLTIFYLPVVLRSRRTIAALCFVAGGAVAVDAVLLAFQLPNLSTVILEDVLLVNDPGRGLSGGITGRDNSWEEGLHLLRQQPLTGYGFRMAGDAESAFWTHSGLMALLVDCGFVAGGLLIAVILYDFLRRIRAVYWLQTSAPAHQIDVNGSSVINRCCLAYLSTIMFLWAIEPVYLNLGNCVSVMFILLLMSPYAVARSETVEVHSKEPRARAGNFGGRLVNHF